MPQFPFNKDKILIACCAALILLAVGSIVFFCLHLPIQTDEITSDTNTNRSIIDHYTVMGRWPQCGEANFSQKLPWLWIAPAWINHLIYASVNQPLDFRIIGMARVFTWLALWLAIFKRLFQLQLPELTVLGAAILAFFALDHVFLLLLMARPEQSMVLGISIAIALAVYAPSLSRKPLWAGLSLLLFTLNVLYLGYLHPKSLVLLPLLIVTGFRLARTAFRSFLCAFLFSAAMAFIMLDSEMLWLRRFECPGFETQRYAMARHGFPFHLLWDAPVSFVGEIIKNFVAGLTQDLSMPDLRWKWLNLPASYNGSVSGTITSYFAVIAFCMRLAAFGFTAYYACKQLHDRFRGSVSAGQAYYNSVALCLLAALVALFVFQGIHMFYFPALDVPLLLLAALFTFGFQRNEWLARPHARAVLIGLTCGAMASLVNMLTLYQHPQEHENINKGILMTSFSPQGYEEKLPAMRALANTCGIDPQSAIHPVTDDITYLLFRQSFQPYHIFYVSDQIDYSTPREDGTYPPPHFDMQSFAQLLDRNGSSGILSDCRDIPIKLLPYTTQRDGFCCVRQSTIHTLAHPQSRP